MSKKTGLVAIHCVLVYVLILCGVAISQDNSKSFRYLNKWVNETPFKMIKDPSVKGIFIKSFGSDRYKKLLGFTNSMGGVAKLDKINSIYFNMQDGSKANKVTIFINLDTGAVASCWYDFNTRMSNKKAINMTSGDYWIDNDGSINKLEGGTCEELFWTNESDDIIKIYHEYNHKK